MYVQNFAKQNITTKKKSILHNLVQRLQNVVPDKFPATKTIRRKIYCVDILSTEKCVEWHKKSRRLQHTTYPIPQHHVTYYRYYLM